MNKLPNLPIQIVGRDNVSNLYDLLGSRPLVLALHRFFGCTLSQYEPGNLIREYRSLESPGFDLVEGVQVPIPPTSARSRTPLAAFR